jgi:hypothetical protein
MHLLVAFLIGFERPKLQYLDTHVTEPTKIKTYWITFKITKMNKRWGYYLMLLFL